MESLRPDDKEALRQRLQELQHAEQPLPAAGFPMQSTKEPPVTSPPPELSDLNYRFVRQYLSPGEAVTVTAQPKGLGPWYHTPVFQQAFQSSKPNVRVTITPRHGEAVEYIFTHHPSGRLLQIPTTSTVLR